MMKNIDDIQTLESIYESAVPAALTKVVDRITPLYARWIVASKFCVLSTVGPEGTDASPRGDVGPVVHIADDRTLMLPDWRGNNRIDSLRNIVRDGRASLMFMVPHSQNVVRINGRAALTADRSATLLFEADGKRPKTVIVFTVEQAYFQCAKAIMRSGLWNGVKTDNLPTAGQFLKERDAEFDAKGYDEGYPVYAKDRMW
jgi:uncharacterized protein